MRLGYALKRFRDVARAGLMLKKLNARDGWTREELAEFQSRRLLSLVAHAKERSPFYRELYRNVKTDGPVKLEDLPIMDKATVMDNFDQLVTDPRLKLTELHTHLGQLTRDEYYLGEYRVLTTSGSSGLKGVFVFNRREWSTVLAGSFRAGFMMGITSRFPSRWKITWIGADSPMHVSQRMAESTDLGHTKVQRLNATSRISDLVDALNAFQPEVLLTYPSIASLLAIEQMEGRLSIHPQVVETGAEVRTTEMTQNIREAWGITPFNLYGTTEAGAFNVDCALHRGIHLFEDLWIAEVVDAQNRPVPDGSRGHKVLATNLFNYTQPLIRYEVGDMLTVSPDPCSCGRPFQLVEEVLGRSDDIAYLPGPGGREVPVHPIHFHDALGALPEVKEYRVLHDDHGIAVTVVLRAQTSEEGVADKLTANLSMRLASLGAECPAMHVCFVDRIDRDASTMGKLKLVTSHVKALGV
ncbi:MAG: hypothetical protein AB1646_08405 [Thermodesulfobacteriota bacterium]